MGRAAQRRTGQGAGRAGGRREVHWAGGRPSTQRARSRRSRRCGPQAGAVGRGARARGRALPCGPAQLCSRICSAVRSCLWRDIELSPPGGTAPQRSAAQRHTGSASERTVQLRRVGVKLGTRNPTPEAPLRRAAAGARGGGGRPLLHPLLWPRLNPRLWPAQDINPWQVALQCLLCPITCPIMCAFNCCLGCCLLGALGTAAAIGNGQPQPQHAHQH